MRNALFLAAIIFIWSCNDPSKTDDKSGTNDSATQDLIKGPSAVYYSPDSNRLDSLKRNLGDGFETAFDDWSFYLSQARQFTDSMHLRVINTNSHLLRFAMNDGSVMEIPVNDTESPFGLYFFNGNSVPEQVDIVNDLESQYENTFN
jgi:hypothetical protein